MGATKVIGGKYDAMDPKYMEWMSTQVQKGVASPPMEVTYPNTMMLKAISPD